MTRVSSLGQTNFLLQDVLRVQKDLFNHQKQTTTGMKSDTYTGIARDVGTLSGAKAILSRSEQFMSSNIEVERRLTIYDATMESLRDVAQEMRDNVLAAVNTDSGIAMRSQLDNLFDTTVNLLNTRDNGRFIYSGTRTDTAPVKTTTSTALSAITADVSTTPANVFANNSLSQQTQVDDNLNMSYGILGEDIGKDLMESMRRMFRFDNGTENFSFGTGGPFSNPLTTDQANFLKGELQRLNNTIDTIDKFHAKNGVNQMAIEDIQERHQQDIGFMKVFISDIEEVDIGEAITKMQQDQVALEASYRVLSQVSRATLLDFI
jgi:flagellar hook-associated protein 3 FlgL